MYASKVKQQRLHFAVSGKLWNRSLVMIDEETKTLWSHLLGRGMQGELAGTQLKTLSSVLTDWESWRAEYPETRVLKLTRTGKEFTRDFYANPARFVLGVSRAGRAKAWPFEQLLKQPLVNDQFLDTAVVVYFEPQTGAGYIYERQRDARPLTFRQRGDQVIDVETQSTWNLARGEATAGPLAGQRLPPLVAIPSFRKSWLIFYPESLVWQAESP